METNLKKQLITSAACIKKKIKMMQDEEDAANLKLKKVFKPITDPLETLIQANDKKTTSLNISNTLNENDTPMDLNSSIVYEKFQDQLEADSSKHSEYYDFDNDGKNSQSNANDTLISLKKEDLQDIYDNINIPFGIRNENKKLMMGNSVVTLSLVNKNSAEKQYMITINEQNYEFTPGLKELLIRNKPNLKLVTEKDKIMYKHLLVTTSAHRRDFNPNGQLKGDKGLKYCQIIKPLFSDTKQDFPKNLTEFKIGGSLPKLKKYKKATDYIYWDDPNELIERLKLLIASKSAGNSNHDNEILSIIEELKESGIIKE